MKNFKSFIIVDAIISFLILIAILAYRTLIEGKPLGFVIIGLVVLLLLNGLFCIVSVLALNRGHGKLVSKLWVFSFTFVLFYLFIDLVGGFIFLNSGINNTSGIPDKIVHHKAQPYKVSRDVIPGDYDVIYRNNDLGFRGRSGSEEKEPSVFRILMLGDSFTFGPGVKDDETACYLLEEYLNKTSGRKYEVINLGVNSYAAILEYLQLKQYIGFTKPDLVIMNFDMSDVMQEYAYRQSAEFGTGGEPLAVNGYPGFIKGHGTMKARISNWVYGHMFITTALIELSRKYFEKDVTVKNLDIENAVTRENKLLLQHTLKDSSLSSDEFHKIMSMSEDSILRAKKLCEKYGVEFILTTYPWGHQVNDKEWIPGKYKFLPKSYEISDRTVDELAKFSQDNGIPFFNAFPSFRAYKGKELLYNKNDMHFTAAGQKLWAQSLYKFVVNCLNENHNPSKHSQGVEIPGSDR